MSKHPHDDRIDYVTYEPPGTPSEISDDDLQTLHDEESHELADPHGDDAGNAFDDDWEAEMIAVNGSAGESNDHRITRVRRAIELHRERKALRDVLADGYADPWDNFDSARTEH